MLPPHRPASVQRPLTLVPPTRAGWALSSMGRTDLLTKGLCVTNCVSYLSQQRRVGCGPRNQRILRRWAYPGPGAPHYSDDATRSSVKTVMCLRKTRLPTAHAAVQKENDTPFSKSDLFINTRFYFLGSQSQGCTPQVRFPRLEFPKGQAQPSKLTACPL